MKKIEGKFTFGTKANWLELYLFLPSFSPIFLIYLSATRNPCL